MFVFHVLRHEKNWSKIKNFAQKRFDSIKTKRTRATKSTAVSGRRRMLLCNWEHWQKSFNHSDCNW